nr:nucleoprotein [Aedes orthomyxo-like virus 2]
MVFGKPTVVTPPASGDVEMREASGSAAPAPSTSGTAPKPAASTKRKNVDVDGKEVPDSKRNKAIPDKAIKTNVIKLLLHWHEYMRFAFGVTELTDIDDVCDLTSILHTIHNRFRQETNGTGGLRDTIKEDFEFEANRVKITYGTLEPVLRAIARTYGFQYVKTDEDRKRIGTLSSILALISAFRSRFAEVRLGNASLLLKKTATQDENIELEQFKLNNTHSPHMTGCRYTPSTQSSMKQSLGPLTITINLCMNTDSRYAPAWKAAFCQAFKLIRGAAEIAELLSGSKKRYANIVRLLGDICHFGIARTSNKAFLPMATLLTYARENALYTAHFAGTNELTDQPITDAMLGVRLHNIDFSGHGLLAFWNGLTTKQYTLRGDPSKLTPNLAGQALFHAVFGTHKENLNLLKWMTEQDFVTRRDVGDKFQGRGSCGLKVKTNIIPFVYFSKLVSAAQTDFLRGGIGQISRAPTFSGKFHTNVDNDSELFRVLQAGPSASILAGANPEDTARAVLESVKLEIQTRLRQDKRIEYGTTDFYSPDPAGTGEAYGPKVAGPGEMAPYFYYQHD